MSRSAADHKVLPGFRASLAVSIAFLLLLVVVPLIALILRAVSEPQSFLNLLTDGQFLSAFRVSLGSAIIASVIDLFAGFAIAWSISRIRFPGHRIVDALVDLPLALPTAVAGITLATVLSPDGWIGRQFPEVQLVYNQTGIVIALSFIGLPFVVRSLQPVMEELDQEAEDAAYCLGAGHSDTFRKVILPQLIPAWISGFSLALGRCIGEYGSVIFIAGNMPLKTEIVPLVIISRLEQYNYDAASAIGVIMILVSVLLLGAIQFLKPRERP